MKETKTYESKYDYVSMGKDYPVGLKVKNKSNVPRPFIIRPSFEYSTEYLSKPQEGLEISIENRGLFTYKHGFFEWLKSVNMECGLVYVWSNKEGQMTNEIDIHYRDAYNLGASGSMIFYPNHDHEEKFIKTVGQKEFDFWLNGFFFLSTVINEGAELNIRFYPKRP